jgi:selenide, water dikinase
MSGTARSYTARVATQTIRLTQLSHGAGCACKLPARLLTEALAGLPRSAAAELLVGHERFDDAAVWRISDELAVVQTIDFFTPVVDDPYDFGRIAAANAFSDVYAMGARPAFCLNVVAFPRSLDPGLLAAILAGGADVATAAGAAVAGGHSIDDPEPKYGMAVSGFVHPERVWTNGGGRDGDVLVLGKPIGTGIVTTALKRGDPDAEVVAAAVASMTTLNAAAAEALAASSPNAVTDVTGFGLVGHVRELAAAAGLAAELDLAAVPLLPGARELAGAGFVPGGTRTNVEAAAAYARFAPALDSVSVALACDAQTSGGLLAALPPDGAAALGWPVVGRLRAGEPGRVLVD